MNEAMKRIQSRLDADLEKLDKLMEEYPDKIPNQKVAEFLHVDNESYIAFLESGALGMSWRKAGKLNKAHTTLTNQFVRWYLGLNPLEDIYR